MSDLTPVRPLVPVPRNVEQLAQLWRFAPCAGVWLLMLEGRWPTLEEECARREAAAAQAP